MFIYSIFNFFKNNGKDYIYNSVIDIYTYLFLLIYKKYPDLCINKHLLISYKWSETILYKNINRIPIYTILENKYLTKPFLTTLILEEHIFTSLDFYKLVKFHRLDDDFLEKNKDKLNWSFISCFQYLKEETIERFSDKLDWNFISLNQNMSVDFILKNKDKINWFLIIKNKYLKFDFIFKCQNYIDWNSFTLYSNLNPIVFSNYKEKINWELLSSKRILNEEFIFKFVDYIDFNQLLNNNENQKKEIKYYSKKLIQYCKPHLNNFKIYNQKTDIIISSWKKYKKTIKK